MNPLSLPRLQFFSLLTGTLVMPLLPGVAYGLLLVVLGLRLLQAGERTRMLTLFHRKEERLLPVIFYFMYLIGLTWTSNFTYAGLDLQSKAPLLLLPFAIGNYPFKEQELQQVKTAFRVGCLLAGGLLLMTALFRYIQSPALELFFYTEYSRPLMHPTYLSMFLTLSVLFAVERLQQSADARKGVLVTAELLFLALQLILLSARMALMAAAVVALLSLLWNRHTAPSKPVHRLLYLVFISGSVLLYTGASQFSNRFSQVAMQPQVTAPSAGSAHNSTTGRLEIWKESIILLESRWLAGTGTGDVKDELLASYARNNFQYGLERKLNSHNQFLQTWLTLGISGLLVLLGMFWMPCRRPFRKERRLFYLLVVMACLNALTESILEVQKGVLCIAFFYSLFLHPQTETTKTI